MDTIRKEIWKAIKGYEGSYEISNEGRVRSVERERINRFGVFKKQGIILKGWSSLGYVIVSLSKNGERTKARVHRLVAEAFIPNPTNNPEVNHKDGNKSNNEVSNLEWCTHQENILHACRNGLKISAKGVRHAKAKLTEKQVVEIYHATGTCRQLAEIYGVTKPQISLIKNEKTWKHVNKNL